MAERMKLWIAGYMKELMRQKPLDKIRVTEICSLAGIERSTFYYHFQDKYDLVAWIFTDNLFETDVISVESSGASLDRMRKDYWFYKHAYEDHSQNSLWHYMLGYFAARYTELIKNKLGTDTLSTQLAYSVRHYCAGSVTMTREWILSEDPTPSTEIVSMMFGSMPENMREVLFPPGGSEE